MWYSTPILGGVSQQAGVAFFGTRHDPYGFGQKVTGLERATAIAGTVSAVTGTVGGGLGTAARFAPGGTLARVGNTAIAPKTTAWVHRQLVLPNGAVHQYLAGGAQGGLRRQLGAYQLNHFRNNSTRFYAVLSDSAAARIKAGGAPWPTGFNRANLGEGLYTWASRSDAARYLQRRMNNPTFDASRGTQIRTLRVSNRSLNRYSRLDLRGVDDVSFQRFIDRHTAYADGFVPYPADYIIYPRAIGVEHFFNKSVAPDFWIR